MLLEFPANPRARGETEGEANRDSRITLFWPLASGRWQLPLVPGMQINAEIHIGTRTVLEYLLSPVQKVAHEAGRER
jgi:hypothetical protein